MGRRAVLAALATLGAGAALFARRCDDGDGVFVEPGAARDLGAIYLATQVPRPTREDLVGLLGAPPLDAELGTWLSRRQREDFEAGRVIDVDGWLLSETEVRLCALLALS